jgi:LPXTG-motif cell wall-anchored protein
MNPETGFDGTGLIILAAIAALILVVVIRKRNKNKPTKNPNEPETGKEPRESTKKKTSKLEQNRRARELQEKKDNAKKEARRVFRITAPVVFIGFSIAIGWPNLVDFFTESTGVNAKAANFLAFIFAFGT